MINQKESKEFRIDFLLLQPLSRVIKTKTKNKDQPTNNHKNNRKVKAMRNITPTWTTIPDHYPLIMR